jgi:hypothetical protein
MVFVHRFELRGCNEAMLADVNKAALAGIPGVEFPIDKSAKGCYIVSVESELGHLGVLSMVSGAFASLVLAVSPL